MCVCVCGRVVEVGGSGCRMHNLHTYYTFTVCTSGQNQGAAAEVSKMREAACRANQRWHQVFETLQVYVLVRAY